MDTQTTQTFDPSLTEEQINEVKLAHLDALIEKLEEAEVEMEDATDEFLDGEIAATQDYVADMKVLDDEAQSEVGKAHEIHERENLEDAQTTLNSL